MRSEWYTNVQMGRTTNVRLARKPDGNSGLALDTSNCPYWLSTWKVDISQWTRFLTDV